MMRVESGWGIRAIAREGFIATSLAGLLVTVLMSGVLAHASEPFAAPKPEELAMTSVPGYPGLPAAVLFREETMRSDLHMVEHYERIKILTEDGKKFANVDLGLSYGQSATQGLADSIKGRTIHADGKIIPYSDKPHVQIEVKSGDVKVERTVFTLPQVEVGSVIEYRYFSPSISYTPQWLVQGKLFVMSAHYHWNPSAKALVDRNDRDIVAVAPFAMLPAGVDVVQDKKSGEFDLKIANVAPIPDEEYMLPSVAFAYKVFFNYSSYKTGLEYWKGAGKDWSKAEDDFIGPKKNLEKQTDAVTTGSATDEEKLKKIYAEVMRLENTDYTRKREAREDKAAGLKKINKVGDILSRRRGNSVELTELFVGMARAAGMNAYLMLVSDRSKNWFLPNWLSIGQFDDLIAIVAVNGKEESFDPGSRYCRYGRLAWEHTLVQGLRQTATGADFATTSPSGVTANPVFRTATLKIDEHGETTGTIELKLDGAAALHWRETALGSDAEGLHTGLENELKALLPKTLEVKTAEIKNLEDYEVPLVVRFEVSGQMGVPTGKRLVLPADIFMGQAAPIFPEPKRDVPVYFHYPQYVQDAVTISFPEGLTIESVPKDEKFSREKMAQYAMTATSTATSVTTHRAYANGELYVPVERYTGLRSFTAQWEAKDQESVVLKAGS